MSLDHYETEYHLTPQGWVEGTSKYYGKIEGDEVARPDDAVETWLRDERQSSSYSRPVINWSKLWADPNVSEQIIRQLHSQFPRPE